MSQTVVRENNFYDSVAFKGLDTAVLPFADPDT